MSEIWQPGRVDTVSNGKIPHDQFGRPYMQIQRAGHAPSWAIDPMTHTEAKAVKARELVDAQAQVTALQIVADSGQATKDDESALSAWRQYLVAVSRLDVSLPDRITWPTKPIE
ncbi:MAG: tail fiber assembly protein [Rouxiella badensis]|uniref:tail fiber assembly protein n=1 Tax=Rouxiella badensis TaxID=1646377 RepID=UPI003C42C812